MKRTHYFMSFLKVIFGVGLWVGVNSPLSWAQYEQAPVYSQDQQFGGQQERFNDEQKAKIREHMKTQSLDNKKMKLKEKFSRFENLPPEKQEKIKKIGKNIKS